MCNRINQNKPEKDNISLSKSVIAFTEFYDNLWWADAPKGINTFDNLFTSFPLFDELSKFGMEDLVTVRKNSLGNAAVPSTQTKKKTKNVMLRYRQSFKCNCISARHSYCNMSFKLCWCCAIELHLTVVESGKEENQFADGIGFFWNSSIKKCGPELTHFPAM